MGNTFKNIDEYILLFPEDVQKKLDQLRAIIHSENPEIEEYIGYQMPAFRYKGKPLVYFAAYKNHIGFYPGDQGIKNFEKDFLENKYKFSKGAVQFSLDKEIPSALIRKIIQFKIATIHQKKS
ncbi:iron chaperone [Chryseobacterium paridis]|uniref:DUF1801 domain-containing protein n=1 Tax=Chryseobacterium paridis TaxID=2800328 RepID=A0ABS1FQE1_9FLAO|nr:DUF1801 domain-containing protein [Chryseobacterium paridis]MBK1894628.1 DUF1801 domain-containing protein [Chryseobacterium paridis]